MNKDEINEFRQSSRKLIRELGLLQLNTARAKKKPQHWHALIEISKSKGLTISELSRLLLLSISATSRIVTALHKDGLIDLGEGVDKREKYLVLTRMGDAEIENMDEYSNIKIRGAFNLLSESDQIQIVDAIKKYAQALETSRLLREDTKILTLSTSRTLRKQIISMIESIQKDEYLIPITQDINACILRAEEVFYYNHSYNFWYAIDNNGTIIGSIGLKKIDANNGEIKKFFVTQKYRGKGIAQKLIHTLVKAAMKHHFQSLYLGTVDILQAAQRFYTKYGFRTISVEELPQNFEICSLDTQFFKGNIEKINHKVMQIMEGRD